MILTTDSFGKLITVPSLTTDGFGPNSSYGSALTTDGFSKQVKSRTAATSVRTAKNNHQVAGATPTLRFGPAGDNYFWLSFVAYKAKRMTLFAQVKRIFTGGSNEKIRDLFVYGSWDLRVQR